MHEVRSMHRCSAGWLSFASLALLAGGAPARALSVDLVLNGDFEFFGANSGVGQMAPASPFVPGNSPLPPGGISVLNWTRTTLNNPESQGWAFIVDGNAATTGFPSVFSQITGTPGNLKLWGNGFGGSPNGGFFMGISAGFGRSEIKQTISGLTVGSAYKLAFEWAAAQLTDQIGATSQYWQVQFGNETRALDPQAVPSQEFVGWLNQELIFTATSATQDLTFTPFGTPTGQDPFLLLDGVSLRADTTPPAPTGVPGPLPLLGAAAAWRSSRRLRRRLSGKGA